MCVCKHEKERYTDWETERGRQREGGKERETERGKQREGMRILRTGWDRQRLIVIQRAREMEMEGNGEGQRKRDRQTDRQTDRGRLMEFYVLPRLPLYTERERDSITNSKELP